MNEQPSFIYAFFDPIEPDYVRYIGFSTNPKRPYSYVPFIQRLIRYNTPGRRPHVINWMKGVLVEGRIPDFKIIAIAGTPEEGKLLERKFIAEYRRLGHELTNLSDGGDGTPGYRHTKESKKLMSQNRSRPETVNSWREKVKIAFSTDEHQKLRSEATKKHWNTEEKIKKKSLAIRAGYTDEVRKKMSEFQKNRFKNPEARKVRSDRAKEIMKNPEVRRKISEGMKLARAKKKWK